VSDASAAAAIVDEQEALALRLLATTRKRPLDAIDRFSEIIFGIIMVLTFTCSLAVAESGREEVRGMLVAALGCNVAWGVVDGVMYVVTSVVERARKVAVFQGIRAGGPGARAIVRGALPEGVSAVTDDADLDRMVARVRALPGIPVHATVQLDDLRGAVAACLLTVVATFPPVIPFLVVADVGRALRISNAVAVACLFLAGWRLGKATGVRAWLLALAMVLVGAVLVGIAVALGG
jgi:VIT1/CCC1 family predicted Fe2+/Mn2+ transporter